MKNNMSPKGKFVFVDDNIQEHVMFKRALSEFCNNEVISAYNGEEAFDLIKKNKDDIFIIICDMSMPRINGIELKRMIEVTPELKIKSIPFIFHSTNDNPIIIKEAYALGIQGYVMKSDDLAKSINNLDIIIKFWSTIVHPNTLV